MNSNIDLVRVNTLCALVLRMITDNFLSGPWLIWVRGWLNWVTCSFLTVDDGLHLIDVLRYTVPDSAIQSTGPNMIVRFFTDGSVQDIGFQITYKSVTPGSSRTRREANAQLRWVESWGTSFNVPLFPELPDKFESLQERERRRRGIEATTSSPLSSPPSYTTLSLSSSTSSYSSSSLFSPPAAYPPPILYPLPPWYIPIPPPSLNSSSSPNSTSDSTYSSSLGTDGFFSWPTDNGGLSYGNNQYPNYYGSYSNYDVWYSSFDPYANFDDQNLTAYDWPKAYDLSEALDYSDFRPFALFTDYELSFFSTQAEDFIAQCTFDGRDCGPEHFKRYSNPQLGNCFVANSVFQEDLTNGLYANLKNTSKTGKEFGLKLTLFLDKEEYIGVLSQGSGAHVSFESFQFLFGGKLNIFIESKLLFKGVSFFHPCFKSRIECVQVDNGDSKETFIRVSLNFLMSVTHLRCLFWNKGKN